MEASKRIFLPAIAPLMLLFAPLILGGCNPLSQDLIEVNSSGQDLIEAIPTLDGSPTIVSTESGIDQPGILEEVFFDFDHTSNGLSMCSGGDVDTEVVNVGDAQEQAWRTGNGRVLPSPDGNTEQDWYMQFQVDDDFIYEGSPTSQVRIEIEYLDEGTDKFNIQYDAVSGGPSGDGQFKESDDVTKTGTGEFKTAVFTLSDAYFANRDNDADFRISDYSDGAETIRRVTITLLTSTAKVKHSPTEIPPAQTGPLTENQANVIFHNGVILTMEEGSEATAIAIKDERIMGVGNDNDMLAYAGAGTTLIDLEGRTMMPGFVDPHSHVFNNVWRDDLEGGQAYLLSNGITTTGEMFVEDPLILDMQALDQEEKLRMRVSLYLLHVDNCGDIRGDWYVPNYPVSRKRGAMLQIPGVKIFNDGGSCNIPAVSFEYVGVPGHGDLYFEVDKLAEMVITAQNLGYQVAIHALGDRAIEVSQDAIAAALAGGPNIYHHRIDHNTLLRDEMLPRYSEIDIVTLIFGYFPACFFIGDTSQFKYITPKEFEDWEWRWRPLIDANPDVHFAWHSDTPVMMGDPIPLKHLHGFVTRKQMREDGTFCEPPDWAADDLLTVEEALPMMTIEAAYALLREDEIGSLKAGKLADLIILSDNPLEVDHDAILDIQVLMTMVGGKVEHCAQGHEALCP